MLVPVLAVKALDQAKQRLAPAIGPIQRRLLTLAMLEDVLAAVAATPELGPPMLVSPDHEVGLRASALGCEVIDEAPSSTGLNHALTLAARTLAGRGDDHLLVIAADLPLVSPSLLGAVARLAANHDITVVGDRHGTGTNLLSWKGLASFRPAFGPKSLSEHTSLPGAVLADAAQFALLAADVDTVDDLKFVLPQLDGRSRTATRIRELRLSALLGGE